jgi:hypothetical protein
MLNTGVGYLSMSAETEGNFNTASGAMALGSGKSFRNATAIGYSALSNYIGNGAIGVGVNAGFNLLTGSSDVAIGNDALKGIPTNKISGSGNIAIGDSALLFCQGNCAANVTEGQNTGIKITTGSQNLILGDNVASTSLATGRGNILIGTSNATDTFSSATNNEINIGGLIFGNTVSLSSPTIRACGTNPSLDSHANNHSGIVTVGRGSVTSCTVTFAGGGYSSFVHCRITSQAPVSGFSYSYTKSAITVSGSALTSDEIDYDCDGY